jgi:hypothetical protein
LNACDLDTKRREPWDNAETVDGLTAEMALIWNPMRKVTKDLLLEVRMRWQTGKRKKRKRKSRRKRRRTHRHSSDLSQKMLMMMTLVTNLHPRNLLVLVDPRQVMVKPVPTTRTMIENEIRSMPMA